MSSFICYLYSQKYSRKYEHNKQNYKTFLRNSEYKNRFLTCSLIFTRHLINLHLGAPGELRSGEMLFGNNFLQGLYFFAINILTRFPPYKSHPSSLRLDPSGPKWQLVFLCTCILFLPKKKRLSQPHFTWPGIMRH